MHGIALAINTATSGAAVYSALRAGIDNTQEQLNETVFQGKYMSDNGFSRSRITGMAPVWTFTGIRIFGDAAQDYIFARKYSLGASRETTAKITFTAYGYAYEITFPCTIANVQEFSGAADAPSAISIEIHINGEPTVTITAASPSVEIGAALYKVTAPVKSATPQATHDAGTGYTAAITWSPTGSTFAGSTVYTATVVYTAASGYVFAEDFSAIDVVNLPASGTSVVRDSATQLTITAVNAATGA